MRVISGTAAAAALVLCGHIDSAEMLEIEPLKHQIEVVGKRLNTLCYATGSTGRKTEMQEHWEMVQTYLRRVQYTVRMMPDAGAAMVMNPGTIRRGSHIDWVAACPMMGESRNRSWIDSDVESGQYCVKMRENVGRMHEQVAKIAQTVEQAEQQELMRAHWLDSYRRVQSIRGKDWMWGADARSEKALPAPSSLGAGFATPASSAPKLINQYCTHCHAAPRPELLTWEEWDAAMSPLVANQKIFSTYHGLGAKAPSEAEIGVILGYMRRFAQ